MKTPDSDPQRRTGALPEQHVTAQAIAAEAAAHRIAGRDGIAKDLYARAAELESAALVAIPSDKRRTIGILGVSVASLWYHAGELDRAERVARELLTKNLLPSAQAGLRDLLDGIRKELDDRVVVTSGPTKNTAVRRQQRLAPSPFSDRLREHLTPAWPLGPSDAAQIDDVEIAAALFDPHNKPFNTLLRRDLSVLTGRRGSGKTALLNSYVYRPYIDKYDKPSIKGANSDYRAYDIVVSVDAYKQFDDMQQLVVRDANLFRPIEAIVDDWERVILDYFFARLVGEELDAGTDSDRLLQLRQYLNQHQDDRDQHIRERIWGVKLLDRLRHLVQPARVDARITREDALAAAEHHLAATHRRALIIFDSMDQYEVGDSVFNRSLAGLIRFITNFNRRQKPMAIKLVLPAEILPEVARASANPLKDLISVDQLSWTTSELAQIGAHRYRLFLELYDPDVAVELRDLDLNDRHELRTFWERFFPESQKNLYGVEENSLLYLLRHTQLLPRQFLMLLRQVAVKSFAMTGGYREFKHAAITAAVEVTEPYIATEILQAYTHVYPVAEELAKPVFANFPTMFSYDELEDRWRKKGRHVAAMVAPEFDTAQFSEMLIRMGIIGLGRDETERYYEGQFAYESLSPLNIGEGHSLCLHPIFSRHFNAAGNRARKVVMPSGIRSV